jgi:Acetyltransferases, including N-acetylases of ribosomal proteins
MSGTIFLEGEKINLRTVEEEDIEFLRDGVNHPEVRVYMGNRRPQNYENEEEFFEEQVCGEKTVHLLISWSEERIGIISLTPQGDDAEKLAEIGIWIHPEYHGNGYGTEASKLLVEYGFNQLNYHKLYARAYQGNKASQSVWEKLGFEKEGVLKDHTFTEGEYKDVVYYGVLEGEWD